MTVTGVITALARSSGVDLDGFLEFGLARLVAPRRHAQLGWAGYGLLSVCHERSSISGLPHSTREVFGEGNWNGIRAGAIAKKNRSRMHIPDILNVGYSERAAIHQRVALSFATSQVSSALEYASYGCHRDETRTRLSQPRTSGENCSVASGSPPCRPSRRRIAAVHSRVSTGAWSHEIGPTARCTDQTRSI